VAVPSRRTLVPDSDHTGGCDMGTRTADRHGLDQETIERLSTEFNRCFERLDAGEDVFTPDAFFDLMPPFWRFQLRGPETFAGQLAAIAEGPASVRMIRVIPTDAGFVLEHEETQRRPTGEAVVARRVWLCTVDGGRISEVIGYCNGGWDDALRARHAAEAPMIRG
jgi:hypothetical protein